MTQTAAEWEEFFQANHVPAARVRTLAEAVADPQMATRDIVHRYESAPGIAGQIRRAGRGLQVRARRTAGRHAAATDRRGHRSSAWQLGYSAAEIGGCVPPR